MRECEQKALNFLIKSGWVLWGNASMAKGSKLACEDVSGELRMIHLAKAVNCSRVAYNTSVGRDSLWLRRYIANRVRANGD